MALREEDKKLSKEAQDTITRATEAYERAYANKDYNAMREANNMANEARKAGGVSTYDSSVGDAQRAGRGQQAYATLQSTPTTTNQNKAVTPTYSGNRYVKYDDFNIDMNRDYSADMQKYKDDAEALKILEQARNAKIAILKANGINDYDETYNNQDYDLSDTSLYDSANSAYIDRQRELMNNEISAQRQMSNAQIAQLQEQQRQLEQERQEASRQQYIDNQLDIKALEDVLASQGISGGDIESAKMNLINSYIQNYANNQNAYNKNIANVDADINETQNTLATNVAAIRSTYGDAVANAYLERATNKANAEAEKRREIISRLGL